MVKCKIGIIGFGTVGKGVYKILKSNNDYHPILKDIEIKIESRKKLPTIYEDVYRGIYNKVIIHH